MSGLPAKPSSCSTAISTGRPWQSQPARRGTCQPCMVLKRGKTSLNARASMWCVPGPAVGGRRPLVEDPLRLARRALQRCGRRPCRPPSARRISLLQGGQVDLRGQRGERAGRVTHAVHSPRARQTGSRTAGTAPARRYGTTARPWGAAAGEHHGHRRPGRRGARGARRRGRPAAGRPARACPACCSTSRSASRWGRAASASQFENVALTQTLGVAALVVILAEGGLTTRLGRRPPRDRPGARAGHGRASAVSVVVTAAVAVGLLDSAGASRCCWARSSAPPTRPRSSPRCAGCRCPGAWPPRWRLESGLNDAPVILLVARAGRPASPGAPAQPWWLTGLEVVGELVGGAVVGAGDRRRRRAAAAPAGAAAGRASTRWPRSRCACWRSPRRPWRTPRASSPSTSAGWCSGNAALPHRAAQHRLRRGDGLAGPDRPVRAARAARLARTGWSTPLGPGRC